MSSAEEEWFADVSNNPGPSLEDFLATDPSHLPFLQERPATAEDLVRYQIFADDWESIGHLQQVSASKGAPSSKSMQIVNSCCLSMGIIGRAGYLLPVNLLTAVAVAFLCW